MKRTSPKLSLATSTIRTLGARDLAPIVGGALQNAVQSERQSGAPGCK